MSTALRAACRNCAGRGFDSLRLHMDRELMMWTVYQPAPPYPRNHVAREFAITAAGQRLTGRHAIGPLDVMRGYLAEQGLTCLGRASEDDPSIVEVWV